MIVVDNNAASLAWQVRAVDDDARGPVDQVAFVEALGRGVLRAWDNLQTADGTGYGFFNGQVALTTTSVSADISCRIRAAAASTRST